MMKYEVRTPEDALAYIVDCTLATVESMAMKKSRPVHEYERQKTIAQQGIDWLKQFNLNGERTRACKLISSKTNVNDWAKGFEK